MNEEEVAEVLTVRAKVGKEGELIQSQANQVWVVMPSF